MKKTLVLTYGAVAYLAFFAAILYMIGFVGNIGVPKGIDDGPVGPLWAAIAVNLGLVFAFAVQHTIMARPGFKRWWTQFMPKPMERSTFVLASSALLGVLYWQWRPIEGTVWSVESAAARGTLYGLYALGWALVFYASFLINHFDLFGLRQVFLYFRNTKYTHIPTKIVGLYRYVRNPLMLGFLIAFWSAPDMSYTRLSFALAMTVYIFIGVRFEERTLSTELGEVYRAYRNRTPMLIPIRLRSYDQPTVDDASVAEEQV
ncbi:MAG: membrane protein [Phycisphaerae bacterium]|nr:MAG: membrane protein [Phycisphaerae bacterium]